MNILTRFLIIFLTLMSVGCASSYVTKEQYSGYLTDYSKLEKVETASGEVTLRWISEKISSKAYHSIILDKTILYPEPKPTKQVSDALLKQFTSSLDKELNSSVQGAFKVVGEPGTGVLQIKPAVTAVAHSMEGMKVMEILPVAMVLGLGKAAAGTRDQDVDVFLEVAVTDSQTGELLATAVRKGRGAQLENDEEQLSMDHLNEMIQAWKTDATALFGRLAR